MKLVLSVTPLGEDNQKGDMIRFSFRRDHFGSSVGNVFEEGVVKGMR